MTTQTNKQVMTVALFACVLGFLGLLGSDLYLPAMPIMRTYFHTSAANIELSIAVYMIGFGCGPLLFGPLADTFGRKKVVIGGLLLATMSAIAAVYSHHITDFLIARALQGFGAGATLSMFRVMLRDVVQGKRMASLASYTTMIFNLSPVLGMIVGGYLVHYFNWQLCFIVLIVTYLLFIIVYARFCPETLKQGVPLHPRNVIHNYRRVLGDVRIMSMALCSGLAFSVVFAFATSGAFIFQIDLHMSAVMFGWIGFILSLSSIMGKFINAKLSQFINLTHLMKAGFALTMVAGICLLVLPHCIVNTALFICFATGSTAFILSNAMSLGMKNYAMGIGYAASVYGSIQLLTVFLTNSVLAHFYKFGIVSLSVFYIAVPLLSLAILQWTLKNTHDNKATIAVSG